MNKENKQEDYKMPHPKGPKYFEGTLQLRNPNQEVVDFVWAEVDKNIGKHVYIQKSVALKSGLDYYLTSNKFLKWLGKELQNKFGGELKMSAKLFTRDRQTGKEVHRLTVLFRMPEFCRGNEVEYKGEMYCVTGIGRKVFLKHMKTGKKIIVSQRDIKKIRQCN